MAQEAGAGSFEQVEAASKCSAWSDRK